MGTGKARKVASKATSHGTYEIWLDNDLELGWTLKFAGEDIAVCKTLASAEMLAEAWIARYEPFRQWTRHNGWATPATITHAGIHTSAKDRAGRPKYGVLYAINGPMEEIVRPASLEDLVRFMSLPQGENEMPEHANRPEGRLVYVAEETEEGVREARVVMRERTL